MQIRKVRHDDRDEWVRLRDALWPRSRSDHEAETRKYFAERDDRLATFVVERESGRLGGFLETGWRNYAEGCANFPVAYIEGWYIEPDLRRRGLGRDLVRAAEDWARSCGFTEIASDCDIVNDISLLAHRSLGYEEVGRNICFRKSLGDGPSGARNMKEE